MFDLIDRLERQGPAGAPTAIAIALAALALALALVVWSFLAPDDVTRWAVLAARGGAFFAIAIAMVFGMLGARLRRTPAYPPVEESFPSLPYPEFKAAIYYEERPLAACADCLIHLPATFSTGACPRCGSSVSWHEIHSDEDADLVLTAATR